MQPRRKITPRVSKGEGFLEREGKEGQGVRGRERQSRLEAWHEPRPGNGTEWRWVPGEPRMVERSRKG